MDSRLKFLHRLAGIRKCGDAEGGAGPGTKRPEQAEHPAGQEEAPRKGEAATRSEQG